MLVEDARDRPEDRHCQLTCLLLLEALHDAPSSNATAAFRDRWAFGAPEGDPKTDEPALVTALWRAAACGISPFGARCALALAGRAAQPAGLQPDQVISLSLGGPSFAQRDHADHIHVGFRPRPWTEDRPPARASHDHRAPVGGGVAVAPEARGVITVRR